jgi:hypothetical protein
MTVSEELSQYKLDLVGVQEVRWDRSGTELADKHFSTEEGCRTITLPVHEGET